MLRPSEKPGKRAKNGLRQIYRYFSRLAAGVPKWPDPGAEAGAGLGQPESRRKSLGESRRESRPKSPKSGKVAKSLVKVAIVKVAGGQILLL